MSSDPITFGLAWLGYVLLATDFALRDRRIGITTAVVVAAHVVCVYAFRFEWSVAAAWSKSAAGFVIFHSALLAVVAAPALREPWRTRTIYAAFAIASAGGLGAPFRYPELSVLAIPLFVPFGVAIVVAGQRLWR